MLMYLLGGILYTSKGQGKQNLFIDLLQHLVSAGKESACSVEDLGLIPGLRRSPGEGNSYPLEYSGLENSMGSQSHEPRSLSTSEDCNVLLN